MTTLGKIVLVGAVALFIGLMAGMFTVALRPVEPPSVTALAPISNEVSSRRFVVLDPRAKEVVLFESMGGQLKEVSRARY